MNNVDQASGLRALVQAKPQTRKKVHVGRDIPMVAVASGKGGVGKTMVAINLALAARETGRRVLLVDLDPGLADADIMLGAHPPVTLEECLVEGRPLTDAVMVGPGGLLLLPGASGVESLAEPEGFIRAGLWGALDKLAAQVDLVVLDTGAGLSRAVLDPLCRSTYVLMVTNPEPAAITDAYAMLKVLHLRRRSDRVGLMVNRAAGREDALLAATRLRKVSQRFLGLRPELLGWLPDSAEVKSSIRNRRALLQDAPQSTEAHELRALLSRLGQALEATPGGGRTPARVLSQRG